MKKLYFIIFTIFLSTLFSSCIDYNNTNSIVQESSSETVSIVIDQPNTKEESKIIISEFVPINNVNIKDAKGSFSPWIEIKNISDSSVQLSEYEIHLISASNEANFRLENITLSPHQPYLLIINDFLGEDDNFFFASHGKIIISSAKSNYTFDYSGAKPNYSYSLNGESFITTPGYEIPKEADKLYINEVMSSNKTFFKYNFCDWIEFYNDSETTIILSDYYISDDKDNLYKCKLKDFSLKPNEFFVSICNEDEINFNISSNGETIYLTRNDGVIIDSIVIPEVNSDHSYTRENGISRFPSPSYVNNYQGYLKYRSQLSSPLVINEVMSSNSSFVPSNKKYYDWIELKNTSDQTIQLSNYFLSNKFDFPDKYRLPNVNIKPNETYLLYASGKGGTHLNFKISSDKESLYLFNNDGICIDAIYASEIPVNKSFGRYDSELVYFNKPTPNKENSSGYPTISKPPKASYESGFYNEVLYVKLEAEGDIYYTLDGSEPTKNSNKYIGETIIIDKSSSIRAINYNGDLIESKSVTYNYFINQPTYSLPVLKITTTYDDFFGDNGVYTNFNDNIEKKINLAFYVDGIEEFNLDCGISIAGQGSRILPKKSMEVKFKSEYGASKLKYDIFDSGMVEFDTLMLRGGSEDQNRSLFRDEFFTSLIGNSSDMTVWVQNQRPCNLYINDEYFGIYFIRERLNDHYYASYLNTDEENLDVIYYWHSNEYGLMNDWKKLYQFCEENDLSNEENYKYVENLIDIDNWIDYYISRAYTGDKDLANIRLFKTRDSDGKWRIVLFDLDWAFTTSKNPFYTHFGKLSQKTSNDSTIIYNLFKNDEFKDRFLKRLSLHLSNTLSENNVINHLQYYKQIIEPDIQYEINRWNQLSINSWTKSIDKISEFIDDDITTRTEELLEDIQKTLNLTEDQMKVYFSDFY